jgi:hypothetical protein
LRVQIDTNAQGWERCRRSLSHVRLAHIISAWTSNADFRTATLEPFRFGLNQHRGPNLMF